MNEASLKDFAFFWRTYGLIGTKNIAEFHFDKKNKINDS